MSHNFERLKEHILSLSHATDFDGAKRELRVTHFELVEEWDHCPCGQGIKELCFIENRISMHKTYVGNVCVNQFMGIDTGNLFAGLKRVARDIRANPNMDLILYAEQCGYLFKGEYDFLLSICRKRDLSARQHSWKEKINRRILNTSVVRRRSR